MNDSMKNLNNQRQIPNASDDRGKPHLKADMPLWDTPKYLQENAFPIPKELPRPPEREIHPPDPGKPGPSKKQPPPSPTQKASSGKKKPSGKNLKAYSNMAGDGYIRRSPIQSWFNTFMIMNIPIIGWLYLLILALSKKDQRKDFAKAYLVYKLVFFLVALAIIALLLHAGMEAVDLLLQYIEML